MTKATPRKPTPLRVARRRREMTLAELADQVGVDHSNLSRIERGLQQASARTAERLVKALGGAVTELEVLYPERFMG